MSKRNIDIDLFVRVCRQSITMSEACENLNMQYSTFVRHAKKYGCYYPNQGGRGTSKPKVQGKGKIPLNEILQGKHPTYQTFKLQLRILKQNVFQAKCMCCNNSQWLGNKIPLQLHHIDGDSYNHKLQNLQVLCPNCHTFTDNYKSKNKKTI